MGLHSITCHPIHVNPSLPYIWEEGQTSAYYCRNLQGSEGNTNLSAWWIEARVWTTCPRSLGGSAPTRSRTCNLRVTSSTHYCYTTNHHHHDAKRSAVAFRRYDLSLPSKLPKFFLTATSMYHRIAMHVLQHFLFQHSRIAALTH